MGCISGMSRAGRNTEITYLPASTDREAHVARTTEGSGEDFHQKILDLREVNKP